MIIQLENGRKLEVPDGSTPDQIDEIAGHFSQSQAQAPVKSQPPPPSIGRTVLDQGLQGATFGFADEVTDRIGAGIASVATGQPYGEVLKDARTSTKQQLASEMDAHPLISTGSQIAGGLLTGGAASTTKTGSAIANSFRSSNPLSRIAKGIASGATSGAAYGAGTADDGERVRGTIKGAISGGVLGGAIPGIGAAYSGVKSTVAPKIEQATAQLASRAKDFGIPLRLDQVSPTRVRNTVQKISQEIPFSGADTFEATQRQAFTKAVAKTIGQSTDDLSPSTIQGFRAEISKKFDKALGGQTIKVDPTALKAIEDIADEAGKTIDDSLASVVKKNAEEIASQLQAGTISGDKISSIRSQILKRSTKSKNESSQFLNDLIDVLDNTIDQNLTPEKLSEIADARKQWRNFKTIQPLLDKSTDGTINPTELINRVSANKYIDASKLNLGDDDLVDLARIGKQFLPKKGGSDTFQKTALTGGGAALGVTALTNPLAALSAAGTAAAAMTANRGLQAVNSSQKLIDLAIKNSSKATKQLNRPASTRLLEGVAAGNAAN